MKKLYFNYDSNWDGSERELNVFVTEEYSNWEEIETVEEFVLTLIRCDWVFKEGSDFRFTVEDLDKISNVNFENIIENYDYIQTLKYHHARVLGLEREFKERVYKLKNTKFGFYQEIVLFNDIHFITQDVDVFRKKVIKKLKESEE
ncbi:MAG: hypothetical protein RBQ97_09940 [Acholeplasma sp.]|nr:hypothetical protein [Acholeplasma sp.]